MLIATLTLLAGIVVILALIAANGYFVAQEFAYMSVDRARLGAKADAGDEAAARALAVTRRTSFMLSGAQLGITVTGLLVGVAAEPLVGESLATLLGGAGVPAAVSIAVGTVGSLALFTVVQMIFGELFPKNYAIANPEPLARWLARSTQVYLAAFGWLITIFDHAANGLLRLLRIEPVHDVDISATATDLERIVADSRDSGDLPEDLSLLLDRILDFPRHDVEHAMIPRSRVDAVDAGLSLGEVRTLMARSHTRYPVVDERDQPVGEVELVTLLRSGLPDSATVGDLMSEPLVLPTMMALPDALAELGRSRRQLACVVDEYGGFAGVLTVEDLAEELVGEITDEHDEAGPDPVERDGDRWTVPGDLHLDELERSIGHDLPRGEFETVAGLVIDQHGSLPAVGETVVLTLPTDPADLVRNEPRRRVLEAEVLEVERHVPARVRLHLRETDPPDPDREPAEEPLRGRMTDR
ncbi:hemolysin family protein [Kineococcus gynurae]|uniref:Hemolysin family protein n=1 Tax=Kineococcus gynurae TaxID=452979 RepID=A0ABV5LVD0_9ACTN